MVILYDASNVHSISWARRASADVEGSCVFDLGTLDEVIGRAEGVVALVRNPQEDCKLLEWLCAVRTGYPLKFIILVSPAPGELELPFVPDALLSLEEADEGVWQTTVREILAKGLMPRLTDIVRATDTVPHILRVALVHALLRPTPISSIKELAAESGCDRRTLPRAWELVFRQEQDRLIDFLDWLLLLYATGRKTARRSWVLVSKEIGITEDTLARSARKLVGLPLGELSVHGQPLVLARFRSVFERLFGRWPDAPSEGIPQRPRYRVLVVDDQSGILQFIDHTLRRAGFEVSLALSASEALARLDQEPYRPTAVLADVKMPDMDGIELARRIVRRWPSVRIVLMSAFISVDVMHLEEWREDIGHSVQFLSKPFTAGRVIAALREACEVAAALPTDTEAE